MNCSLELTATTSSQLFCYASTILTRKFLTAYCFDMCLHQIKHWLCIWALIPCA
jgi:hypothetical protein